MLKETETEQIIGFFVIGNISIVGPGPLPPGYAYAEEYLSTNLW